ncbi:MAG: GntR family transcriptional regulator [Sulfuriferula sp.]
MSDTLTAGNLSFSPLYKRVKVRIMQGLTNGEWKSGEAIPSESRLAEEFQVSIGTIRKAIDELAAEKILVREQGRGTFVATHTEDRFLYYFFHIVGRDGGKIFPQVEMLSFRRMRADANQAERLQIARGARVIRINNLLKLDGKPVELDDIILPAERFPGLTEELFLNRSSTIYHLYQAHFGINVIRAAERLRAVPASKVTADILHLQAGSPVLEIDRVAYTYNNLPVELRSSHVNTTDHDYFNDRGKNT